MLDFALGTTEIATDSELVLNWLAWWPDYCNIQSHKSCTLIMSMENDLPNTGRNFTSLVFIVEL